MKIQINERYVLTTEHAASSYNQPVLVRLSDNSAYGPQDVIDDGLFGPLPAVDVVRRFAELELMAGAWTHGGIAPDPVAVAAVNTFVAMATR